MADASRVGRASPAVTGVALWRIVAKPAYVLADLAKPGADWTVDSYKTRLARMIESGLVMADDDTGEILIVGWWKDNSTFRRSIPAPRLEGQSQCRTTLEALAEMKNPRPVS